MFSRNKLEYNDRTHEVNVRIALGTVFFCVIDCFHSVCSSTWGGGSCVIFI